MRSRRRPYAAALMGSTAEAVARLGPCPVLVMHADELEWLDSTTGEISLRNVLVAYDFSPHSQLALHYAATLAQQYQAALHRRVSLSLPTRTCQDARRGIPCRSGC